MKTYCLIVALLCCVICQSGYAQASQFTISAKHAARIEQETSGVEKLKKYHKDSLKQARQLEKYWQAQADSMDAAMDERKTRVKKKLNTLQDQTKSKIDRLTNISLKKKRNVNWLNRDDVERFTPACLALLKAAANDFYKANDSSRISLKDQLAKLSKINGKPGSGLNVPDAGGKLNEAGSLNTSALNQKVGEPLKGVQGKMTNAVTENKLVKQGVELNGDVTKYSAHFFHVMVKPLCSNPANGIPNTQGSKKSSGICVG